MSVIVIFGAHFSVFRIFLESIRSFLKDCRPIGLWKPEKSRKLDSGAKGGCGINATLRAEQQNHPLSDLKPAQREERCNRS